METAERESGDTAPTTDSIYFQSYEDLDTHRLMLDDSVRTLAYKRAIESNRERFHGKRVLDIGAGTGILSLFCASPSIGGAAKVYSCEASNLAQLLPSIFSKNGVAGVTKVLHSKVEDLSVAKDLDGEKVDVIVSEWMGFYLLHESMVESFLWARDNLLKEGPGCQGYLFPETCHLYGCPVNVPDLWKEHSSKNYWSGEAAVKYGFDFSPIGDNVEFMSQPKIEIISGDNLLADPQLLWTLDLRLITIPELAVLKDRRFFSINDDGDMHGVGIWWTCTFPTVAGATESTDEPVELSTAPWDPPTHWKQLVVLLPESISVENDEVVGWEIKLAKESMGGRSYKINLELLWGDVEHPVPCDCGSVKCEIIKVYMSNNEKSSSGGLTK